MITLFNINIDLQLFSEEKTEKATPKRRRETREKGQVAKSREIVSAILLLSMFWSIKLLSKYLYKNLSIALNKIFTVFILSEELDKSGSIKSVLNYSIETYMRVIIPILFIAAVASLVPNFLQVGFLFTLKPLTPNLNKINPIEGFKRLFSKNSIIELFKTLLKILLIGYFIFDFFRDNYLSIPELLSMELNSSIVFIGNAIVSIGIRASMVLLIISLFDYGYQIWQFEKNIKMSKQEIKEEYKQTEGNPQIKSKIKERQRQLSLRRMMAEVPKADVIITNPTHLAIAIKYDASVVEAPYVVAKGKGLIAQRIKDSADKNLVPIVENKPLAQALYNSVDIGQQIPEEMYQAVAEILAFVYSTMNR